MRHHLSELWTATEDERDRTTKGSKSGDDTRNSNQTAPTEFHLCSMQRHRRFWWTQKTSRLQMETSPNVGKAIYTDGQWHFSRVLGSTQNLSLQNHQQPSKQTFACSFNFLYAPDICPHWFCGLIYLQPQRFSVTTLTDSEISCSVSLLSISQLALWLWLWKLI